MPRKIAILGGGIAGLSAAFFLSEQKDVEITVYESSCRLGGKGASARGPAPLQRVEEHGLHLWFGFYENAFGMMRRCYRELRDPTMPYARLEDAFEAQSTAVLAERFNGTWRPWHIEFPNAGSEPGLGVTPPSFFGSIRPLIEMVVSNMGGAPIRGIVEQELKLVIDLLDQPLDPIPSVFGRKAVLHALRLVLEAARGAISAVAEPLLELDPVRRGWRLLDTVCACVIGLDESHVWGGTLDDLDDVDFLDWIRPHLRDPDIMSRPGRPFDETCPVVRFVYNSAFAFEDGDVNKPRLAAGVTLRALFRFIGYPGAGIYRMLGSMGDVVIAPLYRVLIARKVKFEFDSKVTGLVPGGGAIESITIAKSPSKGGMDGPLGLDHRGRACWPAQPAAAQQFGPSANVTLVKGTHFDDVVLAMPIQALEVIAGASAGIPAAWQTMFAKVKTTSTQAYQFWLTEGTQALGGVEGHLLGTHVEPVDTECDMSVVLAHENWHDPEQDPEIKQPARSLAYLCGVLPDADSASQEIADAAVRRNALDHVQTRQDLRFVYPGAYDDNGVRWDRFADPEDREGQARFEFQYTRANISPSERYTLSLPGSTRARLRADESGFSNCVLCGDWTRNNYNAGCVEASVVAGMFAARALGATVVITAEDDSWFWSEHRAGRESAPAPSPLETLADILGAIGLVGHS